MSNVEHLIENALVAMENGESAYEAFNEAMDRRHNKLMLDMVSITRDELWDIAQYIKFVYCQYCKMDGKGDGE